MELTRRNFLRAALAAGTAVAGGSALAACSPSSQGSSSSASASTSAEEGSSEAASAYAENVANTMSCDIVVVGAGMSGLTASVEALNGGADVITLESQAAPGGNGNVTSCIMGVGTQMQKDLGIEVKPSDIIVTEMKTFNYGVDGVRWSSLISNSVENIEWLQEQGALFSGYVDNYLGMGVVDTGHWWVGDTGRDGSTGFVTPMVARIEELGGQILTSTAGKELILDESGAVCGIYAESEEGVLQIDCKAVIICTGGFADNADILTEIGYDPDRVLAYAAPGHNGDGIKMAVAAGAKSWLSEASLMEYPFNIGMGQGSCGVCELVTGLWVNGFGQRYTDESAQLEIPARGGLAVRTQDVSYALLDQAMIDGVIANDTNVLSAGTDVESMMEDAVSSGLAYRADSIEELASAAGIDAETLTATVEKYNGFCQAGSDDEFGKDADYLQELATAPYYLVQNNDILFLTTIGGIDTTQNCEVRTSSGDVIEGLYAAGVDGVELYKGLYTIDIPGSCNANNINSGRTAAKQALGLL